MRRVVVSSTRYDGSLRDEFEAELLNSSDGIFRIRTRPGTPIRSPRGTTLELATTTQILFADRWFNVNHMHEIVAPYRNLWYANLAMPAVLDGDVIRWIDLDLDVMCDVDRGILIKDEDLFNDRANSGYYPSDIVDEVLRTRDEILELARRGASPFDRENQIRD